MLSQAGHFQVLCSRSLFCSNEMVHGAHCTNCEGDRLCSELGEGLQAPPCCAGHRDISLEPLMPREQCLRTADCPPFIVSVGELRFQDGCRCPSGHAGVGAEQDSPGSPRPGPRDASTRLLSLELSGEPVVVGFLWGRGEGAEGGSPVYLELQ